MSDKQTTKSDPSLTEPYTVGAHQTTKSDPSLTAPYTVGAHQTTAADGWQPIETAPRDGSPVDLWNKSGYRVPDAHWTGGRKRHGGRIEIGWVSLDGSTMDDAGFTHWKIALGPTP